MFKSTTAVTPEEYIAKTDEPRRSQMQILYDLIRRILPDEKPFIMSGMIGFGHYHYKYASGREGDWMIIGLASQKNYISIYVCAVADNKKYVAENYKSQLPKASIGKSCIRFKKIEDIDLKVLEQIIIEGVNVQKR